METGFALPAVALVCSVGAILYDKFGNPLKKAFDFIKTLEGRDGYIGNGNYRAVADIGGTATIGYGSTVYPNGSAVKGGDTCTEAQAVAYMESEATKYYNRITSEGLRLTSGQLVALTSFAYNVGIGALLGSTMWKMLKAGEDKSKVAAQFDLWVNVHGNYVQGLANRRKQEKQMFLS